MSSFETREFERRVRLQIVKRIELKFGFEMCRVQIHRLVDRYDEDDAALVFASGSHRDFSLPYWHSLEGMSDLSGRGYEVESYEPLDLGDATAHAGWCLHWSPPQPEDCPPRYALSVCYFVDGATRLVSADCRKQPETEDEWSYRDWLDDIGEGQPARHPSLPVVYP